MVSQYKKNVVGDQHLLVVTHKLDADASMESRLSWFRAIHAASRFDTTVVCADIAQPALDKLARLVPRLNVLRVPHTRIENSLISRGLFYLSYRLWHKRVFGQVQELHRTKPFTLVHQVSYCGYREPGECWKLNVPFVWGPLGGTQNLPWRFLTELGFSVAVREGLRNAVNAFQLRYSRRVRRALDSASCVFAANHEVKSDFERVHRKKLTLSLETGIERIAGGPINLRDVDAPLKILWAGRLECWKGLPLLLKALVQIPSDIPIKVRILGDGDQSSLMRRLSKRLGVFDRIEWVGWPPYTSRDAHYEWADVFAFTSLRDTSGTGLLESLAAGVPIIGLDHQGARDIMTPKCAIAVPVSTPNQVITDISKAICAVASDPTKLHQMSLHARERAQEYNWELLGQNMLNVYSNLLAQAVVVPAQSVIRHNFCVNETSTVVAG